ncbi:MAG: hypothetical protein GY754_28405 [bacterium]|nr:hypothetical protein [bacterium]
MKVKLVLCDYCEGRGELKKFQYGNDGMPEKKNVKCHHCNGYGEMLSLPEDMVVVKV